MRRLAMMCILVLSMSLHNACQPSSVRREKEVIRYVSAQDLGVDAAIVISHNSKFIDEVIYPGKEKITPIKDELKQIMISRSGEHVYRKSTEKFYLEPHPVIIDAGVIGNETYLLDLDDGKFSVIMTAANGERKKIPIGMARMVYY